jgi:hypothetical protein
LAVSACTNRTLASSIVNAPLPVPTSIDGDDEGEGDAAALAATFTASLEHTPVREFNA